MIWMPHVTVAAVVEEDNRFLLVEEEVEGRRCFNQPAGHWDPGEGLVDAVVRETLEETGYPFVPESLIGIYHWEHPHKDLTYLRFAFAGRVGARDLGRPLDTGIIGPQWLSLSQMQAQPGQMRSALVLRCVEDYLAGQRYPLNILQRL